MNKTPTFFYNLTLETQILQVITFDQPSQLSDLVFDYSPWHHLEIQSLLHSLAQFFIAEGLPLHVIRSSVEHEINLLHLNTYPHVLSSDVCDMLHRIHKLYHTLKQVTHPIILTVINLVHYHLYTPLTVKDLATELNYSPTYLSSLFKSHCSLSLKTYILMQKLERAKHLLLATKNSTHEISIGLGFSSQSYFCQTFKRHIGVSPKQFRIKNSPHNLM